MTLSILLSQSEDVLEALGQAMTVKNKQGAKVPVGKKGWEPWLQKGGCKSARAAMRISDYITVSHFHTGQGVVLGDDAKSCVRLSSSEGYMMEMMKNFLQNGGTAMFREAVTTDFATGSVIEWMGP